MNIGQIASHFPATAETAAPRRALRQNQNALRSTGGPRTEAGKAASSRNSLRHGLTAQQTLLPGEDAAEFDRLCSSLAGDRKPVGELEIQLTGEIAACMWRLARARRHEADLLEIASNLYERSAQQLQLVMRYAGSIERQLNRAIVRLEQTQATRRKIAAVQPAPEPLPAPVPKPKVMAAGASMSFYDSDMLAASEFVSSSSNFTPICTPNPTSKQENSTL